ncbi:hypothetical protein E2C01_102404 [Portunus trituberculatus]|uniref:Uncharacterized protein n=1 Tax=Portunus trituberculatus TaxID=210409 RepID=A0A5B7KID3_PORTR|nr:hypothetical protein [Portunus trituberculatus]
MKESTATRHVRGSEAGLREGTKEGSATRVVSSRGLISPKATPVAACQRNVNSSNGEEHHQGAS